MISVAANILFFVVLGFTMSAKTTNAPPPEPPAVNQEMKKESPAPVPTPQPAPTPAVEKKPVS